VPERHPTTAADVSQERGFFDDLSDRTSTLAATQRKLNALAGALASILEGDDAPAEQVRQLRAAYRLEKRESITH